MTVLFNPSAFSANERVSINAEKVTTLCLSNTWQKADLVKLKENKFILEDQAEKEALALQLLACLANPDPEIRDGLAFEILSFWLRDAQLSSTIHLKMFEYLTKVLAEKVDDRHGVYQSFSILMLSDVARVDRKAPFLTANQRARLVAVGTEYLSNVRDYRGFSNNIGWRHSIAHSADLMLQLALNPAISKDQLDQILVALASQITAHEQHGYINGEPKRLAIAAVYLFLRKEQSVEDWSNWLNSVIEPSPFKDWQAVYKSEQGLIKLHNAQSFLFALYATIKPSKNETLISMIPALEKAIKKVN